MDFMTVMIIALVIGVFIGIGNAMAASDRKNKLAGEIASLPDFNPSQQVTGSDGMAGLAVDEGSKKVCLIRTLGASTIHKIVDYKDILSVETFEDGVSITKTSRTSQLGGAIVGGLALGGVGAIIGGLSGKTVTTGKVKSIQLRLIINDTQSPLHDITFMNVEGNKGGIIYNAAIQQARYWHGVIDVLIKRADAEEQAAMVPAIIQQTTALTAPSVADEIKKLADLKEAGLLTLDEFQHQKAKLLTVD